MWKLDTNMQAVLRKIFPLLCLMTTVLTGCNLDSGSSQVQGAGIPLPAAVVSLPSEGVLAVKVFKDSDTTPLFSNPNINMNADSVTLEFSAPAGQHIFTVMFEYSDSEFNQVDGTPWPLAYWTSESQQVIEGESLSLDINEYIFVDSDADGISNAQELKDRTNPGDADDPGTTDPDTTDPGTTDPGTTDPGTTDPDTTDPGTTDPVTTDPSTTDPGTTDPGTTDPGTTDPGTTDPGTTDPGTTDPGTTDPGTTDPGIPDGTLIILPDGIWRGEGKNQTPNLGNVIAMVSATRVFLVENDTIYDGTFTMDVPAEGTTSTNSFTGSVDVYTIYGDKLTASAPVVVTGSRPDNNHLTLHVDAVGDTFAQQQLRLSFDKHYKKDSSQARIADIWQISIDQPYYFMVFPIDSNGTVTGASDTDGCLYSGNVLVEDTQFNLYRVEISLHDQTSGACGVFTGADYTGYASQFPDDNTLFMLVANGDHALSFELTLLGKRTANDPHYPRPVAPQDTTVDRRKRR